MASVTFVRADITARTATFDVNGSEVTRPIGQEVTSETLAAHLEALAKGLYIEAKEAEVGAIEENVVPEASAIVYDDAKADEEAAAALAAEEAAAAAEAAAIAERLAAQEAAEAAALAEDANIEAAVL